MPDGGEGVSHSYEFESAVDIPTTLDEASIEHLGVDSQRTVVIYQRAIFIIATIQGELTATEAVEIELWEPPADNSTHEPAALINTLVHELMTVTDVSRRR